MSSLKNNLWLTAVNNDCARLGGHWQDVENSNGSSCNNKQHHKQACKPTVYRPIQDILGVVMAEQGLVHWITQPSYSTKPLHYITVFYPDNVHFGLFSDSYLTKHQKNWKPQGKGCSRLPGTQKRPTAAIQKRHKTTPSPGGQETFATPSKAPVQT